MRASLLLVLLASAGVSGCGSTSSRSNITRKADPAAAALAQINQLPSDTMQFGKAESFEPDSTIAYQQVKPISVLDSPNGYVAVLACKRDSTGSLFLQIELDPERHAIEKLALQYAGASPKRILKQIGNGIGHYEPKTQRYYFSVLYQIISELPDKRRNFSELYPVHGWISTQTNAGGRTAITPSGCPANHGSQTVQQPP